VIVVEKVPRFPASIAEVKGEIALADQRHRPVISKSKLVGS
jgi:hypothetical protein